MFFWKYFREQKTFKNFIIVNRVDSGQWTQESRNTGTDRTTKNAWKKLNSFVDFFRGHSFHACLFITVFLGCSSEKYSIRWRYSVSILTQPLITHHSLPLKWFWKLRRQNALTLSKCVILTCKCVVLFSPSSLKHSHTLCSRMSVWFFSDGIQALRKRCFDERKSAEEKNSQRHAYRWAAEVAS